ncbi:HlyD family secretion protein [Paraburkholderia phytofirmans]|uniref:efflux RND transporter periplasmic adaptor subunit n=1 Tax=Paraburkholderia phytofirmans TaxID=261302 RepID=UPI0007B60C85|nr:HlyD family secretion protein [Paraburkholderia phytofirmans]
MKNIFLVSGRVLLTLIAASVAGYILWKLVAYYSFAPWTRDGHVRADVVQVAPDVSGLITAVPVQDNERVTKGQLLYEIDRERYTLALSDAMAVASQRRVELDEARRESARNAALGELVSAETSEQGRTRVEAAQAQLDAANVAVGVARVNLQRTRVYSPVDGYLNDQAPRVGEFATSGKSLLSIVDLNSFRVDGYFEETRLRGITIGAPVDIKVMGEPTLLHGHVESFAAGIEDRNRTQGSSLLPNINPAFSWVRLAERIPIQIAFDNVPVDFRLIAGRTATVSVRQSGGETTGSAR